MGFKTGLVIGIGVGYVVATRLDPATRQRLESTVVNKLHDLRDDPRVREVVGAVAAVADDVVEATGQRGST
jgi:hypothetical protein